MQLSIEELARAKETLSTVMDEIGLDAYLFEVEPHEGQWNVVVECAVDEGWQTFNLSASQDYLVRGKDDAIVHQFLVEEWDEALRACKRK